ncbi:hypothetical protein [Burkholderia ubonensis]|uniref:hypothetical protein n=1 Tax=Burkholderia ubonensis TaxID=101571 RepID=UPI000B30A093|nr:hypothetical protein [Burkholderia ubonensis]
MIDHREMKEVESLEAKLLEKNASFDEIADHYAKFLLDLVRGDALKNLIRDRERQIAGAYLKMVPTVDDVKSRRLTRRQVLTRLWRLEKVARKSNAAFSALIRCVICCFGSEEQWLQDDIGDETPLYVYLFFLKKVDPGLAKYFIAYFSRVGGYLDGMPV